MVEHRPIDVVARIDMDTAHERNELAGLGEIVAARLVDRFADKVERHDSNFRVFQMRES
jgi:hypothetical protein